MNRAKAPLNWTNVSSWLSGTNACEDAVGWVKNTMTDLQKVKADTEKAGTYNMDSSIFALERFIVLKKYQWAHWFIDRLLTDAEEILYIDYALSLLPKDKSKPEVVLVINEATDKAEKVKGDNPNSVNGDTCDVLELVLKARHDANPLKYETFNEDMIKFGIKLLKDRKV